MVARQRRYRGRPSPQASEHGSELPPATESSFFNGSPHRGFVPSRPSSLWLRQRTTLSGCCSTLPRYWIRWLILVACGSGLLGTAGPWLRPNDGTNNNNHTGIRDAKYGYASAPHHYFPRLMRLGGSAAAAFHADNKPHTVHVNSDLTVFSRSNVRSPDMVAFRFVERMGEEHFSAHKPVDPLKEGCVRLGDWQTDMHPNCLLFHEISFSPMINERNSRQIRLVNHGSFRDVWMFKEYDGVTRRALKMLRYVDKKKFDLRNLDRHRRDAVAYEQTSASPYIADMYGYCANSGIFDYSDGGDLGDLMYSDHPPSEQERLVLARDAAMALADAHNYDERGRATIAHTDIKIDQFIFLDGKYKLNDFNRNRFLSWDPEKDESCGFDVGLNGGLWRSPEEYKYETETEKVDVYSLGLVFFVILTATEPYLSIETLEDVYPYVIAGGRPNITDEILKSTRPFHTIMRKAIDMCLVYDPKERASARQVADFLDKALQTSEI